MKRLGPLHAFSTIVAPSQDIVPKLLRDNVLIQQPSFEKVDELLHLMTKKKYRKVGMITFVTRSKKELIAYIKSRFTVIEAAGGIVEKNGKYLMIHRRGIWDIPKGKLDKKESIKACAKREVEEETGASVKIEKKVDAIWHTYMQNQKYILKKTTWYAMSCLDDKKIKPQKGEGIKEVKWMSLEEVELSLIDSHRSLRFLFQQYQQLMVI